VVLQFEDGLWKSDTESRPLWQCELNASPEARIYVHVVSFAGLIRGFCRFFT
jgi:hypothetical protein